MRSKSSELCLESGYKNLVILNRTKRCENGERYKFVCVSFGASDKDSDTAKFGDRRCK